MFPRGPGKELPRGAILPRFPVVVSRLRLPARATAVWSGMVHSAENGGAHDLFLPRIPIRSHADRRPGHSPRVSPTRRMGRRWLPGRRLSRWLQSRFCQSRISPWLRRTALRLRRTPFWFCRARLRRAIAVVVGGATSAVVVGTATATLVGLGASSLVKNRTVRRHCERPHAPTARPADSQRAVPAPASRARCAAAPPASRLPQAARWAGSEPGPAPPRLPLRALALAWARAARAS